MLPALKNKFVENVTNPSGWLSLLIAQFCHQIQYSLSMKDRNEELNTIQQIACENNYHNTSTIWNKFNNSKHKCTSPKDNQENNNTNNMDKQKRKWIFFTCFGKETRYITKLFKNTNEDCIQNWKYSQETFKNYLTYKEQIS
jgi:hypothetical protein